MRNHDFVSDGFLALIATALCCCAQACSSSRLASLPLALPGYSNDRQAQTSPRPQPASQVDHR